VRACGALPRCCAQISALEAKPDMASERFNVRLVPLADIR
jgi:hypothetical protein